MMNSVGRAEANVTWGGLDRSLFCLTMGFPYDKYHAGLCLEMLCHVGYRAVRWTVRI